MNNDDTNNATGIDLTTINSLSYGKLWDDLHKTYTYLPHQHQYRSKTSVSSAASSSSSDPEYIQQLQHRYETLYTTFTKEQGRLQKLSEKVHTLIQGFIHKVHQYLNHLQTERNVFLNRRMELNCYRRLAHDEALAVPLRLQTIQTLVQEEQDRETNLQKKYSELMKEIEELRSKV